MTKEIEKFKVVIMIILGLTPFKCSIADIHIIFPFVDRLVSLEVSKMSMFPTFYKFERIRI